MERRKLMITVYTVLCLITILVLLISSFFAAYTVFLSMIIALATHTLNTVVCIIGVFLIQGIGVLTWWIMKKLYRLYCSKTGFKIKR